MNLQDRLSIPCEGCVADGDETPRFADYCIRGRYVCNSHAPRNHTARALDD